MATRKAPTGYRPHLPSGCTLRLFRGGDEPALLDLLNRAFDGVWPRRSINVPPIEHLRWKLHSDPLAARLHSLAEIDERIVAARPLWASRVQVRGRECLARYAVDRAVAPEFQRAGLMTAMEALTPGDWFDKFDVLIGIANNWQSINFVPGTPYRRKIDVLARPLDAPIPEGGDAEWSVERVTTFDERVDDLWRRAGPSFDYAAVRSSSALNYRFADPRAGDYTIAVAGQEGVILGYVVHTSWQGTGQIADLLVVPDRLDVLESLLVFALRDLQQAGSATSECWRDLHHPYGPNFERLGFQPRRRQGMTLHAVREGEIDVSFFADPKAAVHIMAGDTDLV